MIDAAITFTLDVVKYTIAWIIAFEISDRMGWVDLS